jgi:hypothetical protein
LKIFAAVPKVQVETIIKTRFRIPCDSYIKLNFSKERTLILKEDKSSFY